MKQVGLFEAKQKLSQLVDEAGRGQRIGITRHGVLKAVLVPAPQTPRRSLDEIFASLRGRLKLAPGETVKDLIQEGRRY